MKFLNISTVLLACLLALPILASQGAAGLMLGSQTGDRASQLIKAAWVGQVEIVQRLIAQRIDPNVAGPGGWTPLMIASNNGDEALVHRLLDAGVRVDAVDAAGWTALMVASQNGHKVAARLLLDAGAHVNAATVKGWTALMSAARNGHEVVARLLLGAGAAHVNATKISGWTALMLASQNGHAAVVRLLLDAGAQVDAVSPADGWTALMLASEGGYEAVVHLLLGAGAQVNEATSGGITALMFASGKGHDAVMLRLIEADAHLDTQANSGLSSLHFAVEMGHAEAVRILIDADAVLDVCDKEGLTPLQKAVRKNHYDVIRVLIDRGVQDWHLALLHAGLTDAEIEVFLRENRDDFISFEKLDRDRSKIVFLSSNGPALNLETVLQAFLTNEHGNNVLNEPVRPELLDALCKRLNRRFFSAPDVLQKRKHESGLQSPVADLSCIRAMLPALGMGLDDRGNLSVRRPVDIEQQRAHLSRHCVEGLQLLNLVASQQERADRSRAEAAWLAEWAREFDDRSRLYHGLRELSGSALERKIKDIVERA